MTTPNLDPTPWGFIEWSLTTIAGVILGIVGFVMRTNGKITAHSSQLLDNNKIIGQVVEDMVEIKDKLSIRPTHEDISKLLRLVQDTLEQRFDQLSVRLDRIDGRIDSILRKP